MTVGPTVVWLGSSVYENVCLPSVFLGHFSWGGQISKEETFSLLCGMNLTACFLGAKQGKSAGSGFNISCAYIHILLNSPLLNMVSTPLTVPKAPSPQAFFSQLSEGIRPPFSATQNKGWTLFFCFPHHCLRIQLSLVYQVRYLFFCFPASNITLLSFSFPVVFETYGSFLKNPLCVCMFCKGARGNVCV